MTFSHLVRVLACDTCGAALEAGARGGDVKCRYCSSVNVVRARDESADLATAQEETSSAMSESQRLQILRGQDNRRTEFPSDLLRYTAGGQHTPDLVARARADWLETRSRIRQGSFLDQERLFHLTMLVAPVVDERSRRAYYESALDILSDARHRHVIRCHISHEAVLAGDLEGAIAWLRPCSPRPTDLLMDTMFRLASAYLAVARENTAHVTEILGSSAGEIPIRDGYEDQADVLRAHAREQIDSDDASRYLTELMRRDSSRIAALEEAIKLNQNLKLCPVSFPQVQRAVWEEVDAKLRPGRLVSIAWYVLACQLPIGGLVLVLVTLMGGFDYRIGVAVTLSMIIAILFVLVPGVAVVAVWRRRTRAARLRDDGRLTVAKVIDCDGHVPEGNDSTMFGVTLTVEIDLDDRRMTKRVMAGTMRPIRLGSYPCLVERRHPANMALLLEPLAGGAYALATRPG